MSKRQGIIILCFIMTHLTVTAMNLTAAADESGSTRRVMEVIGFSDVYGDNVDEARNRAVSNSLVTAIDLATGELIPQTLKVERFKTINQTIYDQPGKFVLGYKVLTETLSGKEYRVLVEATLSMETLREQLVNAGLLRKENAVPRVILLISEQNMEDISPNYWWGHGSTFLEQACERQMTESLSAQGFQVIRHNRELPPNTEGAALPSGPTPTVSEALALGKLFDADIVVVGMAGAHSAGNAMGEHYKSFKGEFTGRALKMENGEQIAEISNSTVAMEADDITGGRSALSTVGTLAAEAIGPQMMAAWQTKTLGNMTLAVIVEGTRNLADFVKFRNILQDLPMVDSVQTSGIKPNVATLSVQLKGTSRTLADAIMLKTFDNFGVNITDISGDSMTLSLVPK